MTRLRFLLYLLASAAACFAQRTPHVAYTYPAGGQRGETFEVTVAGRMLGGPTNVYFSGGGITAKIIDYSRPLTPRELAETREQLRKLQEKKAMLSRGNRARPSTNDVVWTRDDEKSLAELRKKMASGNRPANPEAAEPVTLEVTIDSNARLGPRELRLKSDAGLSNPLIFEVGDLPEFIEETDAPDNRARYGRTSSNQPLASANENEMNVKIPAVLNGQIMPGGVDRFRFAARKGMRLHMAVHARALIPYLANAVPGWFQATLSLHDASGRELAYADDNGFDPDPTLDCVIPSDGEYVVAIKDSIYRGREDFVYRLTIAESSATPKAGLVSSGDIAEQESNDSAASAQKISGAVSIAGAIDRPGDEDVFQFEAEAGSEIVAEILARRLTSPLDSMLRLTDLNGREIARNDDFDDKSAGLVPHQTDSYLRAKLPAKGIYLVHVTDNQRKGGCDYSYRLRVGPPRPDFAVYIVPSGINLRLGQSAQVTAYIFRKDGFTNDVALRLKNPPDGLRTSLPRIPANQDTLRFTVTASRDASEGVSDISFEAASEIDGATISRAVVPADDLMQAFAYHHLVPATEFKLCILPRQPRRPK